MSGTRVGAAAAAIGVRLDWTWNHRHEGCWDRQEQPRQVNPPLCNRAAEANVAAVVDAGETGWVSMAAELSRVSQLNGLMETRAEDEVLKIKERKEQVARVLLVMGRTGF